MQDNNSGKFAYLDVTQEEIDKCKNETFDILTGSYMTERERNVVFYKDTWQAQTGLSNTQALGKLYPCQTDEFISTEREGKKKSRSSNRIPINVDVDDDDDPSLEEPEKLDDDDDDFVKDSTEWVKGVKDQIMGDSMYSTNSIKIREDVDLWICKRHFQNVGIPFGPHPKNTNKLCWYYRPLVVKSHLRKTFHYDPNHLEFRDFPTAYNQQMRSIYHMVKRTPEKFKNAYNTRHMDDVWILRALKHFEWLSRIDPEKTRKRRQQNSKKRMFDPLQISTLAGNVSETNDSTLRADNVENEDLSDRIMYRDEINVSNFQGSPLGKSSTRSRKKFQNLDSHNISTMFS